MEYIIFLDRNWTWLKFPGKPSEWERDAIKSIGARWGRKKVAWYIQREVEPSVISKLLGKEPLGVVEGRAPTKTWDYCLTLAGMGEVVQQSFVDEPQARPRTESSNGNAALIYKFRAMADRLDDKVADKLRPISQNPTPKRIRDYNMRVHDGHNLERLQKALYALADAHESGEIPTCLAGLKTKKEIEPLVRTRGDGSGGYYSYVDTGEYVYDTPEARALQELIDGSPEECAEAHRLEEIRRREAEVLLDIGQIPGFFPTPARVVQRLLGLASIDPGMSVLEPSAGSGAIADVIRESCPQAHLAVCEINYSLRELLDLKGYYLIEAHDFLEYYVTQNGVDGWDRIVMNPPFEHLKDVDHVRHAYDCLSAGGRLVSVMSESAFFRKDKKAAEFREWLDERGGYTEPLEEGAFKEIGVGVKARVAVIDK
jgi:hypothetical protein